MPADTNHEITLDDFEPAKNLPESYPKIFRTRYQVDWLIRHRKEKGFEDCFVKPGKEWLCNTRQFAQRLAEKASAA